jgi:DNA helicase II / ATP-dependent DNA helicase PcrA
MSVNDSMNPAEKAAAEAIASIYDCIDHHQSFLLEAPAGAGKTYSLVKALKYLINKEGNQLIRRHQKIACITYTNVASEEIKSRTDEHPAILSTTIHAFCWSQIKDYQPYLREKIPQLPRWPERIEEAGGIDNRNIDYDLGYPIAKKEEKNIFLSHDDVLSLAIAMMERVKFRALLISRYPILFIDEYQDTNRQFAEALKTYFLDTESGLLLGFFGDHWQKIYGDGCRKVEHPDLMVIQNRANFRSVGSIVNVLNRMRPELEQAVQDPEAEGSVAVYHTNEWRGNRLTGAQWKDDLPPEVAHDYLTKLRIYLISADWDFAPNKTKVLMLTHNVLANEQGYSGIADIFQGNNDRFIKKEDHLIKFFVDTLEPVCLAYENRRFGEMFATLGGRTPALLSPADKLAWANDMDTLLNLRSTGTIGVVLDHIRQTDRPRIPDTIERKQREIEQQVEGSDAQESSSIERLRKLRDVSYQEVIALTKFIEGNTPFSTKHGVKGAEFENVLVVIGRGWNHYNFNQFLEWAGGTIPSDKQDAFERNRNLFYVACSRPKKRLTLLFTQKLSEVALATLSNWFGESSIYSVVDI